MTPKVDFFSGIAVVMISAVFFVMASQFPQPAVGLGAGGYPKFITVVLAILGAVLSAQSYLKIRAKASDKPMTSRKELLGIAVLGLAFLFYLLALKYFGFIVSTPVFLFIFLFLYGERKWRRMVLVSVITTAVTYLMFEYLFQIFLPRSYFF